LLGLLVVQDCVQREPVQIEQEPAWLHDLLVLAHAQKQFHDLEQPTVQSQDLSKKQWEDVEEVLQQPAV
jgi:hypothetical protein